MDDDADAVGSPPCLAPLLVGGHPVDPGTARDVARFRRAERARLFAARRGIASGERPRMTARLAERLDTLLSPGPGLRIAVYWPIRGEPDLREWMARAHRAGAEVLLPVVERDAPLAFRAWSPGCRMERGVWNIPVPAEGADRVPDTILAPLVGVDDEGYRLGNGGGYYDRTLAQFAPLPRLVGVGFGVCRMPTIHPMPWDIPMQDVVLDDGAVSHRG